MSKTKKIVIIVIAVVAALAVAVGCILYFTKRPVKAIDAENVQQAFEIAKENGYKGDFKSWSNTIIYKNDGDKAGIEKVYIDEDEHLMIVLENGVTIDAGEAKTAVAAIEAQVKKENGSADENESVKVNEKEIFTVTFKDYDGTVLKTEKVISGKSANPPTEPNRDGYVFTRWEPEIIDITNNTETVAVYEKIEQPTVQILNAVVSKNEKNVDVKVCVWNNPGIASLVLDVNYHQKLKLKKVEFNDKKLGNSMATSATPFSNPQRISILSATKELKTNGLYATLRFELSDDLKTGDVLEIGATYFEENVFDINMENVNFEIINGKIFID